jgi:predicted 2-oxoglutarate/Fe(II)-dependent dioxygenase YbiX
MPPRILGQHVSEIHDAAGHAQWLHGASSSGADGARATRSLQPIYRDRLRHRKAGGESGTIRSFKES